MVGQPSQVFLDWFRLFHPRKCRIDFGAQLVNRGAAARQCLTENSSARTMHRVNGDVERRISDGIYINEGNERINVRSHQVTRCNPVSRLPLDGRLTTCYG